MPRIAIVGAGIAGLNAALTLHDAGLSCSIYEAASHIGGRMHSDAATWGGGMVAELCGEFIDRDHVTIHALIKRFGLKTVDLEHKGVRQRQNITYLFNHYCGAEEIGEAFQAITPILRQQVAEAPFPTTYDAHTETAYHLDQLSVYEWIERYVPGGHQSPAGRLLDTGCTGFYGMRAEEQSALNLVYMYGPRVSESSSGRSGPFQGTVRIKGGNQLLPLAIARSLPQEQIHLQHQLVAIRRGQDNTITLSFTTPRDPLDVTCEHAILALPFSTLRHVDYSQAGFDALKQAAITQLGYGTISKLFLQFDTRYWNQDGPWPGPHSGFVITDLAIQVLWDGSLGQMGPYGLLVDYMGGSFGADFSPPAPYTTTHDSELIEQYAQRSLEQIEHVFPGIRAHYTGTAALSYPTGDPNLRGSYSCWGVGQYTRFAGYERVRQGPIHFAGEHCSVEAQGYMEGAAREGARAAREILEDIAPSRRAHVWRRC